MKAHDSALSHLLRHFAVAVLMLGLATVPTVGCDSGDQPDHSLRSDVAALRAAHGNPDQIGSLDETAPPTDLNQYRKPVYRTASAR
jgi:hypothetical protein